MELPLLVEASGLPTLEEAEQRGTDHTLEMVTLDYSDGGFRKLSSV